MRTRITPEVAPIRADASASPIGHWLDLERLAAVEVTSEDAAYPVVGALPPGHARRRAGWRAASPGRQTIRLVFDEPRRLRRIWLHFVEAAEARTQEFVLRGSADRGQSFRGVVRQQWNFSPRGATEEIQDYHVDPPGARCSIWS